MQAFTISDNGAGISSDELEKIIDRFNRTKETGCYSKGGGINLACSKSLKATNRTDAECLFAKLKLQKAAEILLLNKDANTSELVYQTGIESPSYFATSFKKVYGHSPTEYKTKGKLG